MKLDACAKCDQSRAILRSGLAVEALRCERGGGRRVTCEPGGIGGNREPRDSSWIVAESGRALEGRGRGGVGPAFAAASAGGFEHARGMLVRPDCGCGPVPSASLLVHTCERIGEQTVRAAPLRRSRAVVDGRAHERVAERGSAFADAQKPGVLCSLERAAIQVQPLECLHDRAEVVVVGSGCEEEGAAHVLAEQRHAVRERALDVGPDTERVVERLVAAQLRVRQRPRQLEEGERIAARALDELAGGKEDGDGVCLEAARGKEDRGARGSIEPVRVVHDEQERPALGRRREQAQGRGPDREPVGRRRAARRHQCKRAPQSSRLPLR